MASLTSSTTNCLRNQQDLTTKSSSQSLHAELRKESSTNSLNHLESKQELNTEDIIPRNETDLVSEAIIKDLLENERMMIDLTMSDNYSGIMGSSLGASSLQKEVMYSSGQYNISSSCISAPAGGIAVSKDQISISSGCRFPKLEECAHFHYERVELGGIKLCLVEDKSEHNHSDYEGPWFTIRIESGHNPDSFLVRRSLDNLVLLDDMLHRCVYDRKISGLEDLSKSMFPSAIEDTITEYLSIFTNLADDSITCGPVLTWMQLDNKGRKLLVPHDTLGWSINTPAVGAAYGVKRYVAQARDEISFEVGDMISVIDMPSPAESAWWRGKRGFEVGFFPQACVATIGDKVPRHLPLPAPLVGSLALSPSKPVLRKHGKLIAFFRSFILSRPSRRRLKQSGILKERVFSCDLGEHLLNSGQDIPMVLKCCAEFIEEHGIVDGIYRLSGVTSNIQKLRRAFDEEREPDLTHPDILQDIHCVSSLLKMYFRELPNPLCTYQLYHSFVGAVQARDKGDEGRLKLMREAVLKLPPPHYRTLRYLTRHLARVATHGESTGMTSRNIAIVWAPNLLRCARLEGGGVAALQGVGVQAVVTEFLIGYSEVLFSDAPDVPSPSSLSGSQASLPPLPCRPKSLAISTPTKLLSLEEARSRHLVGVAMAPSSGYIEVGGGPSSLPDKYHTVLPLPRGWHKRNAKRSPIGWRSFFSRSRNGSATNLKGSRNNQRDTTDRAVSERPLSRSGGSAESLSDKPCVNQLSQGPPLSRTAGHSRSVSHDSYFDCLQSPSRAPMGELSELRLNFDLEEPEMRIFSEDESLVSSPKVKEANRRVMARARPEEFNSAANSGNPSPKKQARLVGSPNGSLRKRYKLEDQLSDIQFIDCSTPEHGNTVYTSVQVHQPPKSPDKKQQTTKSDVTATIHEGMETNDDTEEDDQQEPQLPTYRTADLSVGNKRNGCKSDRYSCFEPKTSHFEFKDNTILKCNSLSGFGDKLCTKMSDSVTSCQSFNSATSPLPQTPSYTPLIAETDSDGSLANTPVQNIQNFKLNLSFIEPVVEGCELNSLCCENNLNLNYSGDTTPSVIGCSISSTKPLFNSESFKKKMSLDLKSDFTDSTVTTPQISENIKCLQLEDSSATTPNYTLDQSLTSETTSQSVSPTEIGYQALTRLDSPLEQRMVQNIEVKDGAVYENVCKSIVYENIKPTFINLQSGNTCKSPIKSTISITYNLKSPAAGKSPEKKFLDERNEIFEAFKKADEDNENIYEDIETIDDLVSCDAIVPTLKANLPSQQACQPETVKLPLLETNLDEVLNEQEIYQTVKVYRNAVSEVNDLLGSVETLNGDDIASGLVNHEEISITYSSREENSDEQSYKLSIVCSGVAPMEHEQNNSDLSLKSLDSIENTNIDINNMDSLSSNTEKNGNQKISDENIYEFVNIEPQDEEQDTPEDDVFDTENLDQADSLECDVTSIKKSESADEKMEENVYENTDFSHSFSNIYVNVETPMEIETPVVSENKGNSSDSVLPVCSKCVDFDKSIELKPKNSRLNIENKVNSKKELKLNCDLKNSNFIVKQLATKFELSPIENPSSLPFIVPDKSEVKNDTPPCLRAKNVKLNKNKITRSLDEHAFTKEFTCKLENTEEFPTRRKSLDSSRNKVLNPPKKLPNIENNFKLNLNHNIDEENIITSEDSNIAYSISITPTTENKISLIQHNIHQKSLEHLAMLPIEQQKTCSNIEMNVCSSEDISSSFKLNRERMEKYKQERRTFLRDKYRSESFRSEKDQALINRIKQKSIRNSDSLESSDNDNKNIISKNIVQDLAEKFQVNNEASSVLDVELRHPTQETKLDSGTTLKNKVINKNSDIYNKTQLFDKKVTDYDKYVANKIEKRNFDSIADIRFNKTDKVTPVGSKTELKSKQIFLDNCPSERRSLESPGRSRALGLERRSLNERERERERHQVLEERDRRLQRDKCSPSVSIRDVAAIFESKSSES